MERLSLLTGIPQSDGEGVFLYALGQALGTQGTLAAVSAALRARGEPSLVALLPAESDLPNYPPSLLPSTSPSDSYSDRNTPP